MTARDAARPPYRAAVVVTALVLAVFVATLAPTVTFWDAGELITAARTLGIPHPPGTPLFVMVAHVWGLLVPIGEFAARTNVLSALFSAAGAGFFFLTVHASLRPETPIADSVLARLPVLGAAAGALIGAFTYTNWQNSNETEVYAVATFTIALLTWLAHRWRMTRGTARAPRTLLLIAYLAGVSIGNHLLALLVGPAIVAFMVSALRRAPAAAATVRRREWAEVAVMAGLWALLIGTGLGSTPLTVLGGVCFLAAAAVAAWQGAAGFALLALLLAAVGITPYLFLFLRSAQHPILNEAAPSSWSALLEVIRRAQYPVRTPLDDPTIRHGAGNPGRTLAVVWLQIQSYAEYFNWQWAKGFAAQLGPFPLRTLVTLGFATLGLRGAAAHRRVDRDGWWLFVLLFLITGLGLVAYMNFKPGFSLGYDRYPNPVDHEVRERDYFFVISFVVWGLWAGIALTELGAGIVRRRPRWRWLAVAPLAAGILVPLTLNWTAAGRRHGADARLAADFAYDLLNSVPPYGILFAYGDNDTFPLWWAQEVAGMRQDVTVVCLALGNTDWYMRQLRDAPIRPFDEAAAPAVWRGHHSVRPDWPLHTMTDEQIEQAMGGYYASAARTVRIGPMTRELAAGTILYPSDVLTIGILRQNAGRRPIAWALTTSREVAGFSAYAVQQGLAYRLEPGGAPRTGAFARSVSGAPPLDVPLTERLVWQTYRYGALLTGNTAGLETTSASIAGTLAAPFTQLATAYEARGDTAALIRNLERAVQISPQPALARVLAELRTPALRSPDATLP